VYADGHYSDALDAYWDAANECWQCAICIGVLGSIGCCRFQPPAPEPPPPPPELPSLQMRHRGPHQPTALQLAQSLRERYEVRGVDEARRTLFYLDDARRYDTACMYADMAREHLRCHVVVWDASERRVLYDSRLMASKWPWATIDQV
jgi:hypothetical protein